MPESETMKQASDRLLLVADLAGTFLFALEGARRAIAGNLDFLVARAEPERQRCWRSLH